MHLTLVSLRQGLQGWQMVPNGRSQPFAKCHLPPPPLTCLKRGMMRALPLHLEIPGNDRKIQDQVTHAASLFQAQHSQVFFLTPSNRTRRGTSKRGDIEEIVTPPSEAYIHVQYPWGALLTGKLNSRTLQTTLACDLHLTSFSTF